MSKKIIIYILLVVSFMIFFINQYIELEYQVNIFEYFSLISDYTENEKQLILEYDPLIYGGNIDEAPLGHYYESHDQYLGYVVDYMNALSIELGIDIVYQPMRWEEAIKALENKETDLCDMIPSFKRSKNFDFTDEIYPLEGAIVIPKRNDNIKGIIDLENVVVAVQIEDYSIEHLKQNNIYPNYIYTNSLSEAMGLLYKNKVDAVIGDAPGIWYNLNELSNVEDYIVIKKPIYKSSSTLATSKDNKEIIPILNKAIFNLKRKGIVDQIEKKWFYISKGLSGDKDYKKYRLIFFILGFIILNTSIIGFTWNRTLQYSVDKKTKELEFTKEELQMTFDGMKEYLVITNKDLKIKNINDSFLSFLNRKKEELINKEIITVDIVYKILDAIDFQFIKDNHNISDFKYNNNYYDIRISIIDHGKESGIYYLFILNDITYEKIENEKMLQANKMSAIGQLAAGIAHEIRNPLGIIRNSTYLLDKSDKADVQKKAIKSINKAVKRGSNIIDNLLNFSRLSNDYKKTIDIRNFLYEIKSLYKQELKKSGIKIEINCKEGIKLDINSASLKHIIINIINNSIDAIDDKGKIEIDCVCDKEQLKLSIMDNGCGMDSYTKNNIFTPFFTTKDVGKGTGLGLYIAYSEIEKIGGDIYVESEVNKGTTVYIRIKLGGDYV